MATLDGIMDYIADNTIVEQGYDGSRWYYRKYANGFGECFAFFYPTVGSGTAQGGLYYHTYSVNSDFPFTFTSTPIILVTPSGTATGIVGDVNYNTSKLTSYSTYRGNSGSVGSRVCVHVFGLWK